MAVRSILRRKDSGVLTVRPDKPISALAQLFTSAHIGAVVVVGEDDTIVGIVSERDIVRHFAERGEKGLAGIVEDIMTRSVEICGPDDRLDRIMDQMMRHHVRHLPVVEGGRLIGMVSIRDVVRQRLEENRLEIDVLRDVARAHTIG